MATTHSGGTISPSTGHYEYMACSGKAIPRSYWYQVVRTALMYSCAAVLFCGVPELWVQRRAERSREPRQVPQDRRDDADSILRMVTVAESQAARRDTAYTSSKATRVCCTSRRQTRKYAPRYLVSDIENNQNRCWLRLRAQGRVRLPLSLRPTADNDKREVLVQL